jgi:hypothetical protein
MESPTQHNHCPLFFELLFGNHLLNFCFNSVNFNLSFFNVRYELMIFDCDMFRSWSHVLELCAFASFKAALLSSQMAHTFVTSLQSI